MSRCPPFESLPNTRDLGGMSAVGGRTVRPGLLIRSGNLAAASAHDREVLADLVGTVVDFRSDKERAELPDPAIPGVRTVVLPIIEDLSAGVTRDAASDREALRILMESPAFAKGYMCRTYEGFVTSSAALAGYGAFVRLLLEGGGRATLWHCTAGKDRAGFASVIVEELLGVDREAIRADYLASNHHLGGGIARLTEDALAAHGMSGPDAEEALLYMFTAQADYLDAAYRAANERWGSFGGFLRDGLGIGEEQRDRLRRLYLTEGV
ncbi:MAG: tyrosine-protein phosphatase [Clostridia bacterium]|nr:tyrosine-protein phosphatase [Clostridia bacterium]